MKKKLMIALIVIAVIVGEIFAWCIAYSMRKSNDNLPPLTTIAEMSEAEVNSLLPGYKIVQLEEVWGEPNFSEDSTASWKIGNITLVVNYKKNGVVVICGLKDENGASVGDNQDIPEPESYAFEAQYIRTDGYSEDRSYPYCIVIDTKEELEAYYDVNKEVLQFEKNISWASHNGDLNKIINKTGRSFDWKSITGGPTTANFVTGTVRNWYGDIEITSS